MTDFDGQDNYEGQSWQRMLAEIGRLLLLLLVKIGKMLLRFLLKGLKWILKWICKGLLAVIDFTELSIQRARAFWNDNNTQEKIRKIRLSLQTGLSRTGHYCVVGIIGIGKGLRWTFVFLAQGSVWLAKRLFEAIIHLRPTLKAIGQSIGRGCLAIWHFLCRLGRSIRLWSIRRKRAYAEFRKNKGFKGLLIDVGVWLKKQVNNYIEEEKADDNIVNEDDIFPDADDVPFEIHDDKNGRVHTFGRSIYNAMRRIVEED